MLRRWASYVLWSCVLSTSCVAREGGFVRLDPQVLAAAQEADTALCGEDGTRFAADDVVPVTERNREDPRAILYEVEPAPPPPGLLIAGASVGGTGLLGLAVVGVSTLPCLGPAGCDLPDWVAPVGWTSLGLAVTGGVLVVLHAAGVDAPEAGARRDFGRGRTCTDNEGATR